ncbi:MAG: hypothetical protein AB1489_01185, partial [Acidobacteriota bacterium]
SAKAMTPIVAHKTTAIAKRDRKFFIVASLNANYFGQVLSSFYSSSLFSISLFLSVNDLDNEKVAFQVSYTRIFFLCSGKFHFRFLAPNKLVVN